MYNKKKLNKLFYLFIVFFTLKETTNKRITIAFRLSVSVKVKKNNIMFNYFLTKSNGVIDRMMYSTYVYI